MKGQSKELHYLAIALLFLVASAYTGGTLFYDIGAKTSPKSVLGLSTDPSDPNKELPTRTPTEVPPMAPIGEPTKPATDPQILPTAPESQPTSTVLVPTSSPSSPSGPPSTPEAPTSPDEPLPTPTPPPILIPSEDKTVYINVTAPSVEIEVKNTQSILTYTALPGPQPEPASNPTITELSGVSVIPATEVTTYKTLNSSAIIADDQVLTTGYTEPTTAPPVANNAPSLLENKGIQANIESSLNQLKQSMNSLFGTEPSQELTIGGIQLGESAQIAIDQQLLTHRIALIPTANNGVAIVRNNIQAHTSLPVRVNMNTASFTVTLSSGVVPITFLPDTIVDYLRDARQLGEQSTPTIAIEEQNGRAVYQIDSPTQQYLFAIIPINVKKSLTISTDSRAILAIRQHPWQRMLDLISLSI